MSSSDGSRLNPVDQVEEFNKNYPDGLSSAIKAGFGGIITTIAIGIALVVDTARQLITEPLLSLISNVGNVFNAMVGGGADIIRQGVQTSIQSIAPGAEWAVGPLTYLVGIAVMAGGMYIFAQVMEMEATSNLIPFSVTDLPIIGAREEDEGG